MTQLALSPWAEPVKGSGLMNKIAARLGVVLHDLFVFAGLAWAAASFVLRGWMALEGHSPFFIAGALLWLAFCAWSVWRTISALVRGGGQRTANFEAMLDRRAQESGRSAVGGFFAFTIMIGVLRLAVPVLLWLPIW